MKLNNTWDANWSPKLRIEAFPSGKASSELSYFTGAGVQKIMAEPEGDTLTIQFGDLGVHGTVEVHCRPAKEVARNGVKLREGTDYRYEAGAQRLTIGYKGATKLTLKAASLFSP